ncbi:hypothetical protein RRG08_037893 [Elysia crispata]|uniref:Peptidase M14 domain-containing protein n=1 Tax=Elysia crispata TaxID=231223 RepID=A0AAE1DHH8_9GAST|nr:hypothetical protein RRG08_037893 [Elysia crispata]KAK3770703.1 hypothetical protein RRG08_037893 [Elysia crispata]
MTRSGWLNASRSNEVTRKAAVMAGFRPILFLLLAGSLGPSPLPSVALSYEGYLMFSVAVKTAKEAEKLMDITEQFDGVTVMSEPLHGKITLAVARDTLDKLRSEVTGHGMKINFVHGDLQRLIESTTTRAAGPIDKRSMLPSDTSVVDHRQYHRYPEIVTMLHQLASHNPDLMEVSRLLHRTHEGREVTYVQLHGNTSSRVDGTSDKPAVVIESGIHAREWITPAVQLWIVEALLAGYRSGDPTITTMPS